MYLPENICVICGAIVTIDSFSDDLSRKEYTISGMCQKCQDETFVEPEEEYDSLDDEPAF